MGVDASITRFSKKYNIPNIRENYIDYFFNKCEDKEILEEYKHSIYYTYDRLINKVICSNIKDIIGDNYCESSASIINREVILKSIKDLEHILNTLEYDGNECEITVKKYNDYIIFKNKLQDYKEDIKTLKEVSKLFDEDNYDYLYHVTY